jgi:hypothetical protein
MSASSRRALSARRSWRSLWSRSAASSSHMCRSNASRDGDTGQVSKDNSLQLGTYSGPDVPDGALSSVLDPGLGSGVDSGIAGMEGEGPRAPRKSYATLLKYFNLASVSIDSMLRAWVDLRVSQRPRKQKARARGKSLIYLVLPRDFT